MDYLSRTIDLELDELLNETPAIAVDGPKGVGKTDTASRRSDIAWYLDDPAQRDILRSAFSLKSIPKGTVLLDEWQQLPQIWDSVRRLVDAGAPNGRFLLTGSASPVNTAGTHSGAGRILSLRMRPMGVHERGLTTPTVSLAQLLSGQATSVDGTTTLQLTDYAEAIVSSGFPGIMNSPLRIRRRMIDAYLQRIVDRDLPDLGFTVRRPETLRRWLAAYAAASSTTTAYSRLLDTTTAGDGTQPAKTTTIAYRDHLSQLWLLDPVPGWVPTNSPNRRLQQAPKHHLADPALAASLLNQTAESLLSPRGAHLAGPLFESLVTLGVRVMAQAAEASVSHLRLHGGEREVDLVVEGVDGAIVGIEVKLAADVSDSDVKHLRWLREQVPDRVTDLVVVTTGTTAYRRNDGIAVVPLALLGP
ncbi:ATP-binding protein [Brevibacterium sediminis]|uniref:ATP-binding protein n=1 Tax=Brevibacterium sediminis TaxID=1857024 RepID=UPI003672DC8F